MCVLMAKTGIFVAYAQNCSLILSKFLHREKLSSIDKNGKTVYN